MIKNVLGKKLGLKRKLGEIKVWRRKERRGEETALTRSASDKVQRTVKT